MFDVYVARLKEEYTKSPLGFVTALIAIVSGVLTSLGWVIDATGLSLPLPQAAVKGGTLLAVTTLSLWGIYYIATKLYVKIVILEFLDGLPLILLMLAVLAVSFVDSYICNVAIATARAKGVPFVARGDLGWAAWLLSLYMLNVVFDAAKAMARQSDTEMECAKRVDRLHAGFWRVVWFQIVISMTVPVAQLLRSA